MPALDPMLDWLIRGAMALLFAASAIHKGRDMRGFTRILADYDVLPRRIVPLVAVCVVGIELVTALLLLLPGVTQAGAALVFGLLGLYSTALGFNLWRGRREIDCGCLGPAHAQPLSIWLVVRNVVLMGLIALTLLPVAPRSLHPVDALSLFGGLMVSALTWHALHVLGSTAATRLVRRPS